MKSLKVGVDWRAKMERKRIAEIICGFLLFIAIMDALLDYRMAIIYLGEPLIIPTVVYMVTDEYCSAIDVPYDKILQGIEEDKSV